MPFPLTDARSGARLSIRTVKTPAGYGYAVRNLYMPASRTMGTFGSGDRVYPTREAARDAAMYECRLLTGQCLSIKRTS